MACEICQKPFVQITNDDLNLDAKPHVCSTCGKSFSLKIQLKRHSLIHTSGVPYICSSCEKAGNKDPKSFSRQLGKKYKYTCDLCHENFSSKRLLVNHSKEHAMESFSSEGGSEGFENGSDNQTRSIIHKSKRSSAKNELTEMSYVCKDCGKSFTQMQTFEKHCLSHQKRDCIHCGKNFVYEGSLLKHYANGKCKSNLGRKANMSFNQSDSDANASSTSKKHICDLCGKSFARKSSLEGHIMVHQTENYDSAGDEFLVDDDDGSSSHGSDEFEIFKKKFRLPKLKIRKTFPCHVCDEVCLSKRALNRHAIMHSADSEENKLIKNESMETTSESTVHENEIVRKMCTSSDDVQNSTQDTTVVTSLSYVQSFLSETESLNDSTVQKTYPCEKCDKVFHKKGRLKKHLLTHPKMRNDRLHYSSDDSNEFSIHRGKRRKRNKNFACSVCEKRFAGETCLKKHMLRHTDEEIKNGYIVKEKRRKQVKIFTCEFCNEEFTGKKSVFEKHRHSHTPEVCGICDERFVDRQSLREHCKVHVGTEEGRMFMECSQKALDAKNGVLPPEPKVEYIYLVLR